MYLDHFRLSKFPFSLTPDPSFLFLSRDHREALAHLLYGVGETGGFVQLTGEVGTGKTTLCRYLMEQVPENVDPALILNPRQTAQELLASVCDELGADYPRDTDSIKTLVDRLNRHLLSSHAEGRRTVLVIDEAQNLSADVLEQIRLLTNLETATTKLLQILLIGQPELKDMMARYDLRQLDQRVTARYHLDHLSKDETLAYIQHRLTVAGRTDGIFTDRAMLRVHEYSKGVPRVINIVCDRALLGAYSLNRDCVDGKVVKTAVQEVLGQSRDRKSRRVWRLTAAGLVLVAVGVGIGFGIGIMDPPAAIQSKAPADHEPVFAEIVGSPGSGTSPESRTAPRSTGKTVSIGERRAPADTAVPSVFQTLQTEPAEQTASPADNAASRIQNLLQTRTSRTRFQKAFEILLSYWHVDTEAFPGSEGCAMAVAAGLRCLESAGNLDDIRVYDRPAIIELYDEQGRAHHVVLAGLFDSSLLVNLGDEKRLVDTREIAYLWSGRFTLLWRPPPLGRPVLAPGMSGADVLWLRRRLERVPGLSPGPPGMMQNPFFDPELKKRVMAFQKARELKVDGVVGQRTLIELNTAVADSSIPVLLKDLSSIREG